MNQDERNTQFALETACQTLGDTLEIFGGGLTPLHTQKLGQALALLKEVLEVFQRDPENPDTYA